MPVDVRTSLYEVNAPKVNDRVRIPSPSADVAHVNVVERIQSVVSVPSVDQRVQYPTGRVTQEEGVVIEVEVPVSVIVSIAKVPDAVQKSTPAVVEHNRRGKCCPRTTSITVYLSDTLARLSYIYPDFLFLTDAKVFNENQIQDIITSDINQLRRFGRYRLCENGGLHVISIRQPSTRGAIKDRNRTTIRSGTVFIDYNIRSVITVLIYEFRTDTDLSNVTFGNSRLRPPLPVSTS